jgi:hypothetical protein
VTDSCGRFRVEGWRNDLPETAGEYAVEQKSRADQEKDTLHKERVKENEYSLDAMGTPYP